MNFFGIGPLELLLILILALIFLGPEELPTVARTLGKLVRDLQALSAEFTEQVRAELGPELEELNKATRELQEVSAKARQVQSAVRNPTQVVEQEVRKAISPSEAEESTKDEREPEASAESAALPPISRRPLTPPQEGVSQSDEGEAAGVQG